MAGPAIHTYIIPAYTGHRPGESGEGGNAQEKGEMQEPLAPITGLAITPVSVFRT
jgi:hypothetical protein